MSTAGDVNGDGVDDLLIGALFADPNGELSGASYVVFGQAPPPADLTPPAITPQVQCTVAGTGSWCRGDVTVSWTVTDPESAITSRSGCDSVTIDTDTAGTVLTCEATSTGGTASESVTVQRDATAPSLAPTVSPNPVPLNGSATASPNASDATSGIAASGCDPVDTASVGPKSVSCTATDQAGNPAGASADYTIVYACNGLPATIVGTNHSEIITGTLGPDVIVARGGSDVVFGLSGDDVICGGSGHDVLLGQGGHDKLFGEAGNDAMFGGAGNDACDGGVGFDADIGCEQKTGAP